MAREILDITAEDRITYGDEPHKQLVANTKDLEVRLGWVEHQLNQTDAMVEATQKGLPYYSRFPADCRISGGTLAADVAPDLVVRAGRWRVGGMIVETTEDTVISRQPEDRGLYAILIKPTTISAQPRFDFELLSDSTFEDGLDEPFGHQLTIGVATWTGGRWANPITAAQYGFYDSGWVIGGKYTFRHNLMVNPLLYPFAQYRFLGRTLDITYNGEWSVETNTLGRLLAEGRVSTVSNIVQVAFDPVPSAPSPLSAIVAATNTQLTLLASDEFRFIAWRYR